MGRHPLGMVRSICWVAVLAACSSASPKHGDRVTAWRDDLHQLATELPAHHANAFFQTTEATWRAAVAALDQRLASLDDDHVVVELDRLIASLGDSHTHLDLGGDRQYPVRVLWFDDGLFVAGAAPDAAWAVGRKLVAIDHHAAADVIAALTPIVAHENEAWLHDELPGLLGDATVLHGAGLAGAATATYTLGAADGTTRDLVLAPGTPVAVQAPATLPLHLAGPTQLDYWNKYIAADRLLYFQYNVCADDPRVGSFASFAASTLAFADQHPVDRFVIDLRSNGGGNSQVIEPLVTGLAARPALAHHVFVLIGQATFSSAMLNAIELSTKLGAKLVGTPTGGSPNGYGEVRTLQLAHSGLRVWYSTKLFASPQFKGTTVPPDLPVHVTSADWFSGKDPYLDAVKSVPL